MNGRTTVVLIIVTFNRLETLQKNLSHVKSQIRKPDQVLIVNNASTGGTTQFLKDQKEFDFIEMQSNLGYGSGLHFGIEEAMRRWDPDLIWMMDDDSFPNPYVLQSLLEASIQNNINGILGLTGFSINYGIPRALKSDQTLLKADFVLVDNALVNSEVIKEAGNFSTDFFMMCEDYEFCLRLRKAGYFVGVLNSSEGSVERQHLGSQQNSSNLIWRGYYHSRNHLLILKEHFTIKSAFFYFWRQFKYLIHSSLFGTNKWLRTKYRLVGIYDGFKNIKGKSLDPQTLKRLN